VLNLSALRGHSRALALLFLTETWERFSFYGMRALLVLYMTEELLVPHNASRVLGLGPLRSVLECVFGPLSTQALSSQIYGLYTSLLYVTPILGGMLADRVLGQYRTILLGAGLMAVGHFVMASDHLFLLALLCIIVGNGCFKPNVSTQVGRLYSRTDTRRDSAFSIFYVGINLGATIAPVVCGTLGELYGWHYGFFAAGVGMVISIVIYVAGRRYLPADYRSSSIGTSRGAALGPGDRKAILALCLVAVVITFFWASYEQQGNAVVLWVRDFTDRSFGRVDLPVTWFQSLNPALIFLLTPPLVYFWARQERRQVLISPARKMATGCFLATAAFATLMLAATISGTERTPWGWILPFFVLITLAELHVSPVALSLFSRVAPTAVTSAMMGVWFMSGVLGNYLAGVMGSYWERLSKPLFWMLAAAIPLIAGCILLSLAGYLEQIVAVQAQRDGGR